MSRVGNLLGSHDASTPSIDNYLQNIGQLQAQTQQWEYRWRGISNGVAKDPGITADKPKREEAWKDKENTACVPSPEPIGLDAYNEWMYGAEKKQKANKMKEDLTTCSRILWS